MDIVIIGGGFAGVYAVKNLLQLFKNDDVQITLVNATNYFLFVPMLHEVATGTLTAANIAEPLRDILRGRNFSFLREKALSVDLKKKKVKTETTFLSYDYLVLATGSTANFYNIPGAEHCLTLKNQADASRLKHHLVQTLEHSFVSKSPATIVVIGAGPTGIELCLEIKEFVKQMLRGNVNKSCCPRIILVHSGDAILPQYPKLQKQAAWQLEKHGIEVLLQTKVTRVERNCVVVNDGTIEAGTIVWTAGVKPHLIDTTPKVAERGYPVNDFLQVKGYSTVFAVGDCAQTSLPMLAQVATKQGTIAAINIAQHYYGKKMKPFDMKVRGILLSLGKRKGAGIIFGVQFHGFFAWWLMRTIYLFKIIGFSNKLKTAYDWTLDLFVKRDTTEV